MINARIENVFRRSTRAGACGSVVNLFDLPFNHKPVAGTSRNAPGY